MERKGLKSAVFLLSAASAGSIIQSTMQFSLHFSSFYTSSAAATDDDGIIAIPLLLLTPYILLSTPDHT